MPLDRHVFDCWTSRRRRPRTREHAAFVCARNRPRRRCGRTRRLLCRRSNSSSFMTIRWSARRTATVDVDGDASFEALRRLDAGAGERIPTLDEVTRTRGRPRRVNVELKGDGTAAPVARVSNGTSERRNSGLILRSRRTRAVSVANRRTRSSRRCFIEQSLQMFEIAVALGRGRSTCRSASRRRRLLSEIANSGYRSLVYTDQRNAIARALRESRRRRRHLYRFPGSHAGSALASRRLIE